MKHRGVFKYFLEIFIGTWFSANQREKSTRDFRCCYSKVSRDETDISGFRFHIPCIAMRRPWSSRLFWVYNPAKYKKYKVEFKFYWSLKNQRKCSASDLRYGARLPGKLKATMVDRSSSFLVLLRPLLQLLHAVAG